MDAESSEKYREEPELRDYIESPEKVYELETAEKQLLLEKAEGMALEIPFADGKSKYLRLIQTIKAGLYGESSLVRDSFRVAIDEKYSINIDGDEITLESRAGELSSFKDLISIGLETFKFDSQKSRAYEICITEKSQQCWINLRLFKVVQKGDITEKNYLYIVDRYVIGKLRGNKVGEQLLKIADQVAQANNCELIFATLVPEDPKDLERLKSGHQKAGYEIVEKDGGVYAAKNLRDMEA